MKTAAYDETLTASIQEANRRWRRRETLKTVIVLGAILLCIAAIWAMDHV